QFLTRASKNKSGTLPQMSALGQERRIGAVRNISALPPRADVGADIVEPPVSANCCREQMQQICCLLDHLVGAREQRRRYFKAERFCGCEINNAIELSWLLDRDV